MSTATMGLLKRRAWYLGLSLWLVSSGCLCYGGGEPPPEDDDEEDDDDATNHTEYPDYDVAGFYLDIGKDLGDDLYGGIAIAENGRINAWSGVDGVHQEEEWLATLTQSKLSDLIKAIDPASFFDADIDQSGEPDCFVEFRLGTTTNTAVHPAGDIPIELSTFYATLIEVFEPYGIEDGCSP